MLANFMADLSAIFYKTSFPNFYIKKKGERNMVRLDLRKVAPTKHYRIRELAGCLGITPRAVYHKLKNGLPALNISGVLYINGGEFREYEIERRSRRKKLCAPEEFYCVNCRGVRVPWKREIELEEIVRQTGKHDAHSILLRGVCPVCKNKIYKWASRYQMSDINKLFKVI